MSLRIVTFLTSMLVFLIIEQSFSLAFPYPEYLLKTHEDDIFNNDDSGEPWDNIEISHDVPSKRDCAGFPCMYTHLSAKAGRASLYRKLARLIDDCVANPSCNPGRRKRSITSALKLLTANRQR